MISRWLKAEDEKLLQLHNQFGPSWAYISRNTPGRSPTECRRRHLKLANVIEGPESSRESDEMIRDGWERSPSGDWIRIPMDNIGDSPFSKLAKLIPTFKHRWQKTPLGWLEEEKHAVLEGFFEHGGNWARIAVEIPRRTPDQCRRLVEKTFIVHANSGIPEVETMKEQLFAGSRSGRKETNIKVDELSELFGRCGLDAVKSKEAAKNKKLSKSFSDCIEEAGCSKSGMDRPKGLLLYLLASKLVDSKQRPLIVRKIMNGDLKSDAQVLAAIQYVDKHTDSVEEKEFDAYCGVNIVVKEEAIRKAIREALEGHREGLVDSRYEYNFGQVLKSVKEMPEMRWADRKTMKELTDSAIHSFLGPMTEADLNPNKKLPATRSSTASDSGNRKFEGEVLRLHKPGENKQLNDGIMRRHLAATGGRVITRFPPEPNGFLHIGHAKAMNFSFRYAQAHNGLCYLRYDDTNPEAEEQVYYDSIQKSVEWLGFEPCKVTAASDYFQQLYEYAVELIKRDKAYVCHMTNEEIHASRGGDSQGPRHDSPWRNRPVDESLREFERMKRGEYEEEKATLRLKMDMQNPNPCMWDLVAYRVLYTPHCRTGRQWNIYPMYDFTHCLCDSIENITHSLCTTEFINAREAYYWVCDQLEVYKAVQWEYGRLNITNTVLSKRKLTKLVSEGIVKGWDDPRIYTLAALRRRGFTPTAINRFVEELGITTASSIVDVKRLENCVRDDLNRTTPRRMAVTDPILVILENLDDGFCEMIDIPNDPRDPSKGDSQVPLTNRLYIDGSDARLDDNSDPNFFRLTPCQPVGLFKAGVISYKRHENTSSDGQIVIYATIDRSESAPKPKTFVQWVSVSERHKSPLRAELRLYRPLFRSESPDAAPGGFLADINHGSLLVKEGLCDARLLDSVAEDKFQFQRLGYFCKDPDSTADRPVFNLTVNIREDPNKSCADGSAK